MMKRSIISFATVSSFLVLFGAGAHFVPHASAAPEPLLIVVGTNFAANDISLSTLKDAFKGRNATLGGNRLVPVNHPADGEPRVSFDQFVLKLKPSEVGRFWVDAKIRDIGRPPTTAASSELAIRIVASLPNAISYGTRSMLSSKVKVITIDGKSANDAGYALKPGK